MSNNTRKPRFSRVNWDTLVDRIDPNRRFDAPVVYQFSGGRQKRDRRNPYNTGS